ncbi:MAG: hypothetical protein ACYTEQ_30985 [Planctomycetota bacterium]|jgi:hypothetical protein
MSKQYGIIFSGWSVQRILDGSKTQTRRIVKPQPGIGSYKGWVESRGAWRNTQSFPGRRWVCPYGRAGDFENYEARWELKGCRWRSPFFLKKRDIRIWLEITRVRVERVQDIGFSEIKAEGVDCPEHDFPGGMCVSECSSLRSARQGIMQSSVPVG